MDLIVTHINADFDGLSSLVAARKLYPNSRLLLPGSQEKAVREFMSLGQDIIKVETERECRLDNINRLVIVDTRLASRIGIAATFLSRPNLEIHIYDHHPRTSSDIKASKDVYKEVGATVTMLVEIIRKRRLSFSPLEATIMTLGVYEETGSLTYRATTKKDVDTVSFLLSKGANLNVVSSYLNRELTKEELAFLVNLIHSVETFDINGIDVAVAVCEAGEYSGELSTMAHKLMDLENFKALFLIAKTDATIRLIARSSLPSVEVNKILENFGGGGHPAASSASVRQGNLSEVKSRLLDILRAEVKVKNKASDIMTRTIKIFSPDQRAQDVKKSLERSKVDCGVVKQGRAIRGIITLSAFEKTQGRRLGNAKIKGFMSQKIFMVEPNTPLSQIQRLIFEKKMGTILVSDKKRLLGIVTRTNVLKALHSGLFAEFPDEKKAGHSRPINISKKLNLSLPREIIRLIKLIDRVAHQNSSNAFLVGGFVRDILLGVRNFDLDVVVEGDAVPVAKELVKNKGGSYVLHRRFGTATVILPWVVRSKGLRRSEVKIDFATARRESYKGPAQLPTVEFSTVKEDLFRRDFTINAMAAAITERNFGQLIDFFGGQKDLLNKKIRVLHDASFIDDPTRIFRAVRFEQRFDFRIEPRTEALIKEAIEKRMLDRTEKQRLRDELILILNEEEPKKALRRMEKLGEMRFIHPKIHFTKKTEGFFDSIKEAVSWFKLSYLKKRRLEVWLMYMMALLEGISVEETEKVCSEFVFRKGERMRLASYKKDLPRALRLLNSPRRVSPSEIFGVLEPLSYEVILAIMAKSQSGLAKKRVSDFLTRYNGVKVKLKGRDLEALGLRAGPGFKRILNAVLYAKLDRGFRGKAQELDFAKRLIAHDGDLLDGL